MTLRPERKMRAPLPWESPTAARTGNPNSPGLPHWPAFNASSQRAMDLDSHPHAGPVPNARKLKTLEVYFAHLRAEAREAAEGSSSGRAAR